MRRWLLLGGIALAAVGVILLTGCNRTPSNDRVTAVPALTVAPIPTTVPIPSSSPTDVSVATDTSTPASTDAPTETIVPSPVATVTSTLSAAPPATATITSKPTPLTTLAKSSSAVAAGTQLGFVWISGDLDSDLAAIRGTVYVIFGNELDPSRYLVDRKRGDLAIRVLRYNSACPTLVGADCHTTLAELGAFAGRYPGLTWETSNEPNIPGQDSLGPGFVAWQNAAYDTIKRADRTATVEGPGVFNWDGAGWPAFPLGNQIYHSGVKFDRVALHVYPQDACMGPNWLAQVERQIDGALALGYPVDITETGDWWPQCATWGYQTPSAETRQSNVAAFVTYAKERGVSRLVWFQNREAGKWPYGGTGWLIDADGSLSPEGKAWVESGHQLR